MRGKSNYLGGVATGVTVVGCGRIHFLQLKYQHVLRDSLKDSLKDSPRISLKGSRIVVEREIQGLTKGLWASFARRTFYLKRVSKGSFERLSQRLPKRLSKRLSKRLEETL